MQRTSPVIVQESQSPSAYSWLTSCGEHFGHLWCSQCTLTFNCLAKSRGIFNCTPRLAYELWPDETNKLIKRFRSQRRAKVFACYHSLGIASDSPAVCRCRLPLLITEICMPFWAFTFGRQRTRFTCPRPVLYVNLLFININYGGQCVCVVIVDAMRCVISRCPRAVGVVIKSLPDWPPLCWRQLSN